MNATISPVRPAMEQITNVTAGGVVGLQVLGISLADWASLAAILWFVLQAGFKIYDRIKKE